MMGVPETAKPAKLVPLSQDQIVALVRVAWLAILLGLVAQLVSLAIKLSGGNQGGPDAIATAAVQTISWPVLVCIGIAFGQTLGKGHESAGKNAKRMGIAGLLTAPIAFTISRALHKGVGSALETATDEAAWLVVMTLAGVKALEYGLLGGTIGWFQKRPRCGARTHVLIGLVIGVSFGSIALLLTIYGGPDAKTTADIVASGVNEVLVPIGCALVLFASKSLSKQIEPAATAST